MIGTAPIERVDVLHGTRVVQTVRPYAAADLGRRVRVLWQGAEYRGRGRETDWQGKLTLAGNRIARFAPVNFLNPERQVREIAPGSALEWNSVTTGNMAGIDLWLDDARGGTLAIETNIVSGEVDLAKLDGDAVAFDGGGLGRRLSVYRLPEADWSRRVVLEHRCDVFRRRRPAGLSARHAGRRSSGLVEPDLSDRVSCVSANDHAVFCSATPSSRIICSRMTNFCGLPVAVIGKSGTKRMCAGSCSARSGRRRTRGSPRRSRTGRA